MNMICKRRHALALLAAAPALAQASVGRQYLAAGALYVPTCR